MEARDRAERTLGGHPRSSASDGIELRRHLDRCSEKAAEFFGAACCVFCPPGTGAGLVVGELCRGLSGSSTRHAVLAGLSDLTLLEPMRRLRTAGGEVETCPVESGGRLDPERMASMLRPGASLACMSWACRTTGLLQPAEELAERCGSMDVPLLVEASVVAGRLPVDMGSMGIPAMVVRSDALGAPPGLDLVLLDEGLESLDPVPAFFEPGPGVPAGVEAAVEELSTGVQPRGRIVSELRDALVEWVTTRIDGCRCPVDTAHLVPGAFMILAGEGGPEGLHARMEAAGLRVSDPDSAERLAFMQDSGMDDIEPDRLVCGCLSPGSSMVDVELFCRGLREIMEGG
ncbi:MAG: aminotransferase class V-fold PLP-dependent enzyme [Candidatus Fermentibacteraceae bacterium]